jgi:hypothetical protein
MDAAQVLYGFAISTSPAGSRLIRIATADGSATAVGPMLAGRDLRGAAFTHTGRLLALDNVSNELLEIDASIGLVVGTPVALTLGGGPYDLSNLSDLVEIDGGILIVADVNAFMALSAGTGALTSLYADSQATPDGSGIGVVGLAWGSDTGAADRLAAFEVLGADDLYTYAPAAGFARLMLMPNVLPGYNAGRGDMASPPPSMAAVGHGPAGGRKELHVRAWPSPTSHGARVEFALPTSAPVEITVHDIAGRPVCHVLRAMHAPGAHSVDWNGNDDRARPVAPGVYLVRLRAGEGSAVARLAIIR